MRRNLSLDHMESIYSLEQLLGNLEQENDEDQAPESSSMDIQKGVLDFSCVEQTRFLDEKLSIVSSLSAKRRPDRARLVVSERKRRESLKEQLLALRSLVPNITKMDKASIVEDAVLYVQELQKQMLQLKQEIQEIDSLSVCQGLGMCEADDNNIKHSTGSQINHHSSYNILQLDVIQVEKNIFHIKILCGMEKGVMLALVQAMESTRIHVQSSNMSASGTVVLTSTVKVLECEEETDELDLKLKLKQNLVCH